MPRTIGMPRTTLRIGQPSYDSHRPRKGCCAPPGSEWQIWWYSPLDSKEPGIHFDWEAHAAKYGKEAYAHCSSYYHEFFHHIVDSWKVESEVEGVSQKEYHSQILKEKRGGSGPLVIEEAMANYFGEERCENLLELYEHVGNRISTSYDLYPAYLPPDIRDLDQEAVVNCTVWLNSSLIVALQNITGKYEVEGITPEDGFSIDSLRDACVNDAGRIQRVSTFLTCGFACEEKGPFDMSGAAYNLQDIPFYIHRPDMHDWAKRSIAELMRITGRGPPIYK